MKLKRILAVALSIATVAGAGVMAAVPASAYEWDVVSNQKGTFYRSVYCRGDIGYKSNYQSDHILLRKYDQTNIRYKSNNGSTQWAVQCGSYNNGVGQKGVYCDILADAQATLPNNWSPNYKTLKVNAYVFDSNGTSKTKSAINEVANHCTASASTNVWVDWFWWCGPDMKSGGFDASYSTLGFKVIGYVS